MCQILGSLILSQHTISLTTRTCSRITKIFHKRVRFGDKGSKVAIGKGEVHISINQTRSMNILNDLCVPSITKKLQSIWNYDRISFKLCYYLAPTTYMCNLKNFMSKLGLLYPLQMMGETPIKAHIILRNLIIDATLL